MPNRDLEDIKYNCGSTGSEVCKHVMCIRHGDKVESHWGYHSQAKYRQAGSAWIIGLEELCVSCKYHNQVRITTNSSNHNRYTTVTPRHKTLLQQALSRARTKYYNQKSLTTIIKQRKADYAIKYSNLANWPKRP